MQDSREVRLLQAHAARRLSLCKFLLAHGPENMCDDPRFHLMLTGIREVEIFEHISGTLFDLFCHVTAPLLLSQTRPALFFLRRCRVIFLRIAQSVADQFHICLRRLDPSVRVAIVPLDDFQDPPCHQSP